MNTEMAYRVGFASELARRGVAPESVGAALRMRKAAADYPGKDLVDAGIGGMKSLLRGGAWITAFSPAIAAGIVGYMMAQSKKVSPADLQAKKDIMLSRETEEQRRLLAERRVGVL